MTAPPATPLSYGHLRFLVPALVSLFVMNCCFGEQRVSGIAAVTASVADEPAIDGAPTAPDPEGSSAVPSLTPQAPVLAPLPVDTFEPAPDPEPVLEPLVINGVGDVNLDPGYIPAFTTEGYEHAFSGMRELFLGDDLTVINLECPASFEGTRVPKQFNFQCDPASLPIIRADGVDVANQGNNHALDYGSTGLLASIANVEQAGIATVGAGVDEAAAHEPALFEIDGWTVAVVGFGGVIPSYDWLATPDRPGMADGDTVATMVAAVEAADRLADVVVVTIHWGVELQSGPPADDVVRAEAMIDAGADMIFGHHPHRLNSMDWYRGRPIAWSLGNFVWPRLSAAGSDTAVAQVIVDPDGSVRACLLDTTIVSDGHPELDDPTRLRCSANDGPPASDESTEPG